MSMKRFGNSLKRRFLKNQRGQAAVVVMITASTMMALSAASVETGHVYYAYQQLVASTNAAVLAGAQVLPNTTQASTYVTKYSSGSGDLNATSMLQNAVATPTFLCLSTVSNSLNVPCQTSTGATGGYNSLSVTQTATVPLWFGGLLGMKQMNVRYTATAAMAGGQHTPWNIAIIQDTTSSMNTSDGGDQCNGTRVTCSLLGIQALLNDLYPCGVGQTCTSSTTYVDSVSLFVFPAVTGTTASKDSTCPTSNPTIVAYTFPAPPSNTTLPSGDTYQVVAFKNNYKTTDAATTLNQAAPIVIAAGDSGQSNCAGIQAPGGEGTYYAQVIYAAQAALLLQQAANPGDAKRHHSPERWRRNGVRIERQYHSWRVQHQEPTCSVGRHAEWNGNEDQQPVGLSVLCLPIGAGYVRSGGAGGASCGDRRDDGLHNRVRLANVRRLLIR